MEPGSIYLDGPVYFERYRGRSEGPTFVCVHGLGGSHLNWRLVGPGLARWGTVLAPDLPGFGRTPLVNRRASVPANRALLDRFIEAEAGGAVILVGNSMGGLIAVLEAIEHPDAVAGLILIAPAMPRPSVGVDRVSAMFATSMVPRVGESILRRRVERLGAQGLVRETLAMVMEDPSRLDPTLVAEMEALAAERVEQAWAPAASIQGARSLVRILARRQRVWAQLKQVAAPTLLLAGARDRLVSIASLRIVAGLRPEWTFVEFDDLGHVPQMEDPARVLGSVDTWLAGPDARILGSHGAADAAEDLRPGGLA